jgi:hypothetical protein
MRSVPGIDQGHELLSVALQSPREVEFEQHNMDLARAQPRGADDLVDIDGARPEGADDPLALALNDIGEGLWRLALVRGGEFRPKGL